MAALNLHHALPSLLARAGLDHPASRPVDPRAATSPMPGLFPLRPHSVQERRRKEGPAAA